MNFLESIAELIGETFARAEWVALFLGLVGVYWGLLAWNGLRSGHTRGFGWGSPEWTGAPARFAGWIWALGATLLIVVAALTWMLKA